MGGNRCIVSWRVLRCPVNWSEIKIWQICWEVALPNKAEWSYTRGDRKIRLLVPDGLRHRRYLIEGLYGDLKKTKSVEGLSRRGRLRVERI